MAPLHVCWQDVAIPDAAHAGLKSTSPAGRHLPQVPEDGQVLTQALPPTVDGDGGNVEASACHGDGSPRAHGVPA